MKVIEGRATGFREFPWKGDAGTDLEGRSGVSRKIALSDGDEEDRLSISEELWEQLPVEVRSFIYNIGRDGFGSMVLATFTVSHGKLNAHSLRIITPVGEVVYDSIPDGLFSSGSPARASK